MCLSLIGIMKKLLLLTVLFESYITTGPVDREGRLSTATNTGNTSVTDKPTIVAVETADPPDASHGVLKETTVLGALGVDTEEDDSALYSDGPPHDEEAVSQGELTPAHETASSEGLASLTLTESPHSLGPPTIEETSPVIETESETLQEESVPPQGNALVELVEELAPLVELESLEEPLSSHVTMSSEGPESTDIPTTTQSLVSLTEHPFPEEITLSDDLISSADTETREEETLERRAKRETYETTHDFTHDTGNHTAHETTELEQTTSETTEISPISPIAPSAQSSGGRIGATWADDPSGADLAQPETSTSPTVESPITSTHPPDGGSEIELRWEDCRGSANVTTVTAPPGAHIVMRGAVLNPVWYEQERIFQCHLHFIVPQDLFVDVHIVGLYQAMKFHPKCIYDRLVVYDGSDNTSVPLEVHCGQPRSEPGENGANFRPNCSRYYGQTTTETSTESSPFGQDSSQRDPVDYGDGEQNGELEENNDLLRLISSSNHMYVVITVGGATARTGFNASMNASQVGRPSPPRKIIINRTTPSSGYVMSPGFGCQTEYPPGVDDWASLYFPEDHVLLLSTSVLDLEDSPYCQSDYLDIYRDGDQLTDPHFTLCRNYFVPLMNFSTSPVVFHFRSDLTAQGSGVLLFYSYHEAGDIPSRTNALHHYLDCSSQYYQNVEDHVRCNLYPDCQDSRDEKGCEHTDTECDGWYAFHNSCYEYVTTGREGLTWDEAEDRCQGNHFGAHLVSINTPAEHSFVRTLLAQGLDNKNVFVGLTTAKDSLPQLYRQMWMWSDETVGYYVSLKGNRTGRMCTMTEPKTRLMLATVDCEETVMADFLCEWRQGNRTNDSFWYEETWVIELPHTPRRLDNIHYAECPQGHLTHGFLICDRFSACNVARDMARCPLPDGKLIPQFECELGGRVSFTLICNFQQDCADGSDEKFCVYRPCADGEWMCRNRQCIREKDRCDGIFHCIDRSDEENCYICAPGFIYCHTIGCIPGPGQLDRNRTLQCGAYGSVNEERRYFVKEHVTRLPPPSIVVPDGYGNFTQCRLPEGDSCPETHFQCFDSGFCLPIYMRCNDVYDCPGHEDEQGCGQYTCPGFYRCRDSRVCLHAEHICDGIFQCPQRDDEWLCQQQYNCPEGCGCLGYAFDCDVEFNASNFPELRYIDASHTGMVPNMFRKNYFLTRLNLADCNLAYVIFPKLPNLLYLDLSSNNLTLLETKTFRELENLQVLVLSRNPLTDAVSLMGHGELSSLRKLDLSFVSVVELRGAVFEDTPNLRILNLSYTGLNVVSQGGQQHNQVIKSWYPGVFSGLNHLEVLDLRGCPVRDFPGDIFQDLVSLKTVHADNYKLCCRETLPYGFSLETCYAPNDEVSSCDDLLRSDILRVCLWGMAALALFGNIGSFGYRLYCETLNPKHGHGVFISNLALSDFLMGVYLAIIGIADSRFRFRYLWNDLAWKGSTMCKVAGFLSLLSSEVSVFIICLITLDRFMAIRFPFHPFRFSKCSAQLACAIAWGVGILLAAIPLLPWMEHWEFYSQTGICIPLPITKTSFEGRPYIFGVMIVLNFTIFLFIAIGQTSIYIAIRNTSAKVKKSRKSEDSKIAHRLASVVVTDFFCWFPIGLLGILSTNGYEVPGDVNVAIAVFALPLNSALNPFLYTYNMITERMRQRKESCLIKEFENKVTQEKVSEYLKNALKSPEARSLVAQWVSDGVLETTDVAIALATSSVSDPAPETDSNNSKVAEEIISIVRRWVDDGLIEVDQLVSALTSPDEGDPPGNGEVGDGGGGGGGGGKESPEAADGSREERSDTTAKSSDATAKSSDATQKSRI